MNDAVPPVFEEVSDLVLPNVLAKEIVMVGAALVGSWGVMIARHPHGIGVGQPCDAEPIEDLEMVCLGVQLVDRRPDVFTGVQSDPTTMTSQDLFRYRLTHRYSICD